MNDPFLKILKEKVYPEKVETQDNVFWKKFEKNNPPVENHWIPTLIPLAFSFLFIFIINIGARKNIDTLISNQIIKEQELLENLDYVSDLDISSMSEDEWRILLKDKNES